MRIEKVTTFSRFAQLKDDWNRLAGDHPLRSWEWAYTWAETMMPVGELMLLVGIDEADQSVGIAPLYCETHWLRGETVRFLGDGKACTDYTTFLVSPDHSHAFSDEVANWLAQRSVGHTLTDIDSLDIDSDASLGWDLIKLEGVDQDDVVIHRFMQRMTEHNCFTQSQSDFGCWQLEFDSDWDEYLAGLSKSQRRNVSLVSRRVLQSEDFTVRTAENIESLEHAMHWFRELHQKRWQSVGEPGVFGDEAFADFLTKVAARLFHRDSLRVLWIEKEGVPIAVDFSFLSTNSSFGYQTGVDPDFRCIELGRALMVAAIRSTHASGRRCFDFLRGDEHYKTRWNAKSRPLMNIEIVPDRSLPQLRQSLVGIGRTVKSVVRRVKSET